MATDKTLLDASIADLDLLIGAALLESALESKEPSDSEKRSVGQRWFAAQYESIHRAVCSDEAVRRQLANEADRDREALYAAVVGALGGVPGLVLVPPDVIGAKLVQLGVDQLCAAGPKLP